MCLHDAALLQQIAEHRVIAELGRRGVVASIVSPSIPGVSILASQDGFAVPILVKAMTALASGGGQVDFRDYLDIQVGHDARSAMPGAEWMLEEDILHVLCVLGERAREDRFFIYTTAFVTDFLARKYDLLACGHDCGESAGQDLPGTLCSLDILRDRGCEDDWALIKRCVREGRGGFRVAS